MIPEIVYKTFKDIPWSSYIDLKCDFCNKAYKRSKRAVCGNIRLKHKYTFCSYGCKGKYRSQFNVQATCTNCNKNLIRVPSQTKKVKNLFCSKSCAAKYNNIHRKFGFRRSKLEKWIEEQLIKVYSELNIHFNKRDTINSELDIYIPSLKLAFELNGIYHYEPIHGQPLLEKIQNNDNRKFQACLEKEIEFVIIDTSQQKYFKIESSQKYLDIITNIIDKKVLNYSFPKQFLHNAHVEQASTKF